MWQISNNKWQELTHDIYCKISNISHTISENFNDYCLILHLFWPIHWSQVLSWEWRCSWSSADSWCSNYIWVIKNFIANSGASYIRSLTVYVENMLLLLSSMKTYNWYRYYQIRDSKEEHSLDSFMRHQVISCHAINSSPPSAAYRHQLIRSTLVQIISCHLFGTKPLSKPTLNYSQLEP